MRRTLAMVTALVLAGAACGGWENPFQPAVVQGHIEADVDPSAAWVALVLPDGSYDPAAIPGGVLRSAVGADGDFRFEDVPAGIEGMVLLGSTGLGLAVHEDLPAAYGGASKDPADHPERRLSIQPMNGASVTGLVTLEGAARGQLSSVGLEGLPVAAKTDEAGRFRLDGLPFGDYELWAEHYGHRRGRARVSLHAGQVTTASLHLLSADGGTEPLGGLCAPCATGEECTSGLCVPHEVDGALEMICSRSCAGPADCGAGFACEGVDEGAGLCVPQSLSCEALNAEGRSCGHDEDCGLVGLEAEGLCVAGACRIPCEDDGDCASGVCDAVREGGRDVHVCR